MKADEYLDLRLGDFLDRLGAGKPAPGSGPSGAPATKGSSIKIGVLTDLSGLYADLAGEIRDALEAYAADVRDRRFPEEQHTYSMPAEELEQFKASADEATHRQQRR